MLLSVQGLRVDYGRVCAVAGVAAEVREGEAVAIVGANGAGKTSFLRAILGLVKSQSEGLHFEGIDLSRAGTPERVRRGLVLVPEGRRIVMSLTVEENLLLGAFQRRDMEAVRLEVNGMYDRFENLGRHRSSPAAILSGGELQMLAIGRALLAKPKLLMLDEPSLGLSPLLVQRLFSFLGEINRAGTALLIVEQNTRMALKLASRAYVMELGRVSLEGNASELMRDERLVSAYLGADASAAPSQIQ